ncbi:MAG: hypothetical protein RJB66_159 [Pseudomonadota bacterium]|jgi:hypothetical protein
MRVLVLAFVVICAATQAFGSDIVIESETKEIFLSHPLQMDLRCEGGRTKTYPTSSVVLLTSATGFFEKSTLTSLIHDDYPRMGDHCDELINRFLSQLPAKLSLTLNIFEVDGKNIRTKVRRQSISGSFGDFKFESRDEY